jgi:hypothetical protein
MTLAPILLAVSLLAVPNAGNAVVTPPLIAHEPLRCVQVKEFPRVDAGITSPTSVKRARVYFKAHQHPDWYYTDMRIGEEARYLALLPQPLPETKILDYYVHALDERAQSSQTDTYVPPVGRGSCPVRKVPSPTGKVAITIGGTRDGQSPIPPGFRRAGIVAFVAVSGALVTGSTLGGGGASSSLLWAGGAATAAGVGVAVASGGASGGAADVSAAIVQTPAGGAIVGVTQVHFAASVSGGDANSLTFEWSFGDGGTAVGAEATHSYEAEGDFAISLTAKDGHGTKTSATTSIKVRSLTGTWRLVTANPPFWVMTITQAGTQLTGDSAIFSLAGVLAHPRSATVTFRYDVGSACPGLERVHAFTVDDTLDRITDDGSNCNSTGQWTWTRQ